MVSNEGSLVNKQCNDLNCCKCPFVEKLSSFEMSMLCTVPVLFSVHFSKISIIGEACLWHYSLLG